MQKDIKLRDESDRERMRSNVTGAQRELLKYYASVTSNRWLMLKIFGVLIIFVSCPPRAVQLALNSS